MLGLHPGATEAEIRAAHHRLMRTAHPDSGGSDWLAMRINQARDVLSGVRGRRQADWMTSHANVIHPVASRRRCARR